MAFQTEDSHRIFILLRNFQATSIPYDDSESLLSLLQGGGNVYKDLSRMNAVKVRDGQLWNEDILSNLTQRKIEVWLRRGGNVGPYFHLL